MNDVSLVLCRGYPSRETMWMHSKNNIEKNMMPKKPTKKDDERR